LLFHILIEFINFIILISGFLIEEGVANRGFDEPVNIMLLRSVSAVIHKYSFIYDTILVVGNEDETVTGH
jgi:hypothetical protein